MSSNCQRLRAEDKNFFPGRPWSACAASSASIRRTAPRESFQIKLRNHRKEPVEIRVREHLFRWSNWEITAQSDPFVPKDANTIEFNVPVKADGEHVVSYTVLYTKLPWAQAGQ